jgi:hypothetical protein
VARLAKDLTTEEKSLAEKFIAEGYAIASLKAKSADRDWRSDANLRSLKARSAKSAPATVPANGMIKLGLTD